MDPPFKDIVEEIEPTPSREALRLIVEVLQDGHRAAVNLRRTAALLTPFQLQSELESIELRMVSQIAVICDRYRLENSGFAPN